jgi:hypothetical protein
VTETTKQHVVLCEGFDDRSFWSGWLLFLGCTDPSDRGKKPVKDARGRPVTGKGRYLFRTPAGSDVVVHPFQGRFNAGGAVAEYLEGLVAAAIQAAFPDRGSAVEIWLAAEPRAAIIPKSYGYSYLAKWYAGHGADDFLREIWRDEAVARELRKRLESKGGWRIVERLVAD